MHEVSDISVQVLDVQDVQVKESNQMQVQSAFFQGKHAQVQSNQMQVQCDVIQGKYAQVGQLHNEQVFGKYDNLVHNGQVEHSVIVQNGERKLEHHVSELTHPVDSVPATSLSTSSDIHNPEEANLIPDQAGINKGKSIDFKIADINPEWQA